MAELLMEGFGVEDLEDSVAEGAAHVLAQQKLSARDQQIEKLGLQSPSKPRTASLAGAQRFYKACMTDEERAVWMAFLPTRYSRAQGEWNQCEPRLIPDEVQQSMVLALDRGVFDDVQIWAPTPQDVDPLVVGVVYDKGRRYYFKIARWGESLASYCAIKRAVAQRRRAVITRTWIAVIALMLGVLTVVSLEVALFSPSSVSGAVWFGTVTFIWAAYMVGPGKIHKRRAAAAERFPVEATMTPKSVAVATG